jgi:adenylylsulfate reductase subunit A
MEIAASEGMQGGPNEVCGSGIKIDPDCATNVAGLFAAGKSADQCRSLHMATTSGIHAGRKMAAYAAKEGKTHRPVLEKQVQQTRERVFAPLKESRTVSWHEYEDVLQRILTEGMGPVRSAWSMKTAWQKLDELQKWENQVQAETMHDLCRSQEVYNMLTVARCMITAALFREESRFGPCHYRLDFPETDDSNWLGQGTVNRNAQGQAAAQFIPLTYD